MQFGPLKCRVGGREYSADLVAVAAVAAAAAN